MEGKDNTPLGVMNYLRRSMSLPHQGRVKADFEGLFLHSIEERALLMVS